MAVRTIRRNRLKHYRQGQALGRPFQLNKNSPQAKGLVGWWPLGTRDLGLDFSGRNSNLAVGNTPTLVTSYKRGLVTNFDNAGQDTLEDLNWSTAVRAPITLSAWVNFSTLPSVLGDYPYIITIQDRSEQTEYIELDMFPAANDLLRYKYGARTISATTAVTQADRWYFFCGVSYSDDDHAIFFNGLRENSDAVSSSVSGVDTLTISGRYSLDTLDHWMEGSISDVRVYNRGLSDSEVYQLFAPQTRWGLYEPIPRVFPVFISAAAEIVGPFPTFIHS